jgi:branched-chain amino acid transport system permease protein
MSQSTSMPITVTASGPLRGAVRILSPWLWTALLLLALPRLFPSTGALATLSLMGVAVTFALAYNMLLGQTGLLSFGHAIYYGLGGFLTAHAILGASAAGVRIPLPLLPLAGALTGLVFGALFGIASTKRAGTVFAMISLGLVELITALALVMTGFFGGEQGIAFDRTRIAPFLGHRFGSQLEVYHLIAAWTFVAAVAMYFVTCTPFGRLCNAVRENPMRVEFLGYSTRTIRFLALCLSGLFAGLAGALAAINLEVASSAMLGGQQSGLVLLMTYIGGVGQFAGPVVGAILITLLQVSLSDITGAWQLYFGLLFMLVVTFVPGGLSGLIVMHGPLLRAGLLPRLAGPYAKGLLPLLLTGVGASFAIELAHRLTVGRGAGATMQIGPWAVDAAAPVPWIVALGTLALGIASLRRFGPAIAARVAELQADALARLPS